MEARAGDHGHAVQLRVVHVRPCKRLHLVWLRQAYITTPSRTGAGALGPRLVGRLTAELVLRSPQYMSCVKYYEIDLRGRGSACALHAAHRACAPVCILHLLPAAATRAFFHALVTWSVAHLLHPGNKITAIENLGATEVGSWHVVVCTMDINLAFA